MAQEQYDQPMDFLPSPQYPSSTVNMPSEKADLIDKIKPDAIVDTFLHRLQGQEHKGGKWINVGEVSDRALTLKGAWDISNLMLAASSQNVSISKINDRDVRARTQSIVGSAMEMIVREWKGYGVLGSAQVAFVREIVLTNTFLTLKQPEGGSIQSLIKGTTHEQRMVNDNQNSKTGWLGGIIRK